MSQHTPGPWTRKPGERFRHDHSAGIRGGGTYIAAALDLNDYGRDAEVEANARLIAKAPEMLDMLQAVVAWHELADDEQMVEAIKSIIAQVTEEA